MTDIILYTIAGVFTAGLAMFIWSLWTAPHGYQDRDGFHLGERSEHSDFEE